MAEDYSVQEGDCVSSVAFERGFFWETIWNLPQNSTVKQKRADPNILREGDVLHIPDLRLKEVSKPTDQTHRFRRKGAPAMLRLRILEEPAPPAPATPPPAAATTGPLDSRHVATEDPVCEQQPLQDKPRANVPFLLDIDGKVVRGQTDRDGRIECPIPPNAREGNLILEPGAPKETVIPLRLGHLDPVSEMSGIKNRLINLGFDCGDITDEVTPAFTAALGAFQAKHGLHVTEQVDQATRDKLKELHGS